MSSLILRPAQKLTYSPLQNGDQGPFCSLRHFPLAPKGRGHVVVGVIWAFSVAPPEKEIPITKNEQEYCNLGIKTATNAHVREIFIEFVGRDVTELGLNMPDPRHSKKANYQPLARPEHAGKEASRAATVPA